MKLKHIPRTPRALLAAGLLIGVATAQAATGYTVDHRQEALVTVGMSTTDVLHTLGRPEADVKYRNEPGPTFTYRVNSIDPTLFDVDFGADGKVVSTSERMDETGGGHGGSR